MRQRSRTITPEDQIANTRPYYNGLIHGDLTPTQKVVAGFIALGLCFGAAFFIAQAVGTARELVSGGYTGKTLAALVIAFFACLAFLILVLAWKIALNARRHPSSNKRWPSSLRYHRRRH